VSLTSVRATFDRPVTGVSTSSMSISGLTVSQVTGTGATYTLTTSTQTAGASYTLTAATSVTDVRGTPINTNARTASFTGFQPPNLVINEVDYDNFVPNPDGGTSLADNAEFVELYNPSTTATVSLAGLSLLFINGTGGATYLTVDLTSAGSLGPQEYLVAANATFLGTLPGTVKKVTIPGTTDLMQNGAPDGVALVAVSTSTVLDALSYEGNTTSTVLGGSIQEGAAATTSLVDSNTAHASLCRNPNGTDTNVNASDFDVCSMPTPGASNVP
ncbi:MAG TPA: lamin tail domain-containing protein, partial [Archangium sp.]